MLYFVELKPSVPFTGPPSGNAVSRQVRIYAINYNVLRIMSGMAGLGVFKLNIRFFI